MNAEKAATPKHSFATHPSARWVRGLWTSDIPDSDKALAVFQPDILVRDQFLSTYLRKFHLEPEKILMLAVLRDGVACFQENVGATEHKKRQRFLDANEWIMNEDRSYFLSFENICDALGFEPSYMRQGLLKWKEGSARGGSSRRYLWKKP